ncbi:hypothetical protein GH5_06144 [Leishmania sp. Ghana 2012 LV757]|uniref:hypothetical protein n=1 Tax=Leishmania sp. Ghana 2012 LV757 TaxID=2803181 RepID=UPI001B558EA3|nr:hypothetical protein GH5_06144 [Leishmania sp. Ghana 2012 LV757]
MPHDAEGDSPADAAGRTSTAVAIDVSISVKLVGIIGCSASGKSTIAHHLACRLDSPLHPISTDNFFFEDVYMQLRTYEDYRCIDYGAVARWMSVLAHAVPTVTVNLVEETGARAPAPVVRASGGAAWLLPRDWEECVHDAWWAQMLSHLPELGKYRRVAPKDTSASKAPAAATAAAAALAQPRSALTEADPAGAYRDDGTSDDDGDASLCAHEAEEEDRRRRSVAASAQRKKSCGGTSDSPLGLYSGIDEQAPRAVVPFSRHVTIYVVWEGLTLLCNRLVNSYIDYAIEVQCDPETACLRRFFRTPRRHLARYLIRSPASDDKSGPKEELQRRQQRVQAAVVAGVVRQVYRPRIEEVWAVRSREQQRTDLMAALEREMRLDGWESFAHVASSTASSSPASIMACDALDLLSPSCFDPPRPSCTRKLAHADAAKALCDGGSGTHLQGENGDAEATRRTHLGASASLAAAAEQAGNDGSACWSADGLPTRAFQIFWESEFDDWLTATTLLSPTAAAAAGGGGAALVWASLTRCHRDILCAHRADEQRCGVTDRLSRPSPRQLTPSTDEGGGAYVSRMLVQCGRLALLQSSSRGERAVALSSSQGRSTACKGAFAVGLGLERQLGEDDGYSTTGPSAETITSALAPFYYEFRYWFYFEVLYYHRIFCPLQAHRLRWRSVVGATDAVPANGEGRSGGCGDTSARRSVPRPWWTMKNDRGVRGEDADELLTQVECISAAIRAIR